LKEDQEDILDAEVISVMDEEDLEKEAIDKKSDSEILARLIVTIVIRGVDIVFVVIEKLLKQGIPVVFNTLSNAAKVTTETYNLLPDSLSSSSSSSSSIGENQILGSLKYPTMGKEKEEIDLQRLGSLGMGLIGATLETVKIATDHTIAALPNADGTDRDTNPTENTDRATELEEEEQQQEQKEETWKEMEKEEEEEEVEEIVDGIIEEIVEETADSPLDEVEARERDFESLTLEEPVLDLRSKYTNKAIVKWFDVERGYGFLLCEEFGQEIFVHQSAISRHGFQFLEKGDEVTCIVATDDNGKNPRARQVADRSGRSFLELVPSMGYPHHGNRGKNGSALEEELQQHYFF